MLDRFRNSNLKSFAKVFCVSISTYYFERLMFYSFTSDELFFTENRFFFTKMPLNIKALSKKVGNELLGTELLN